jgi:hypothetical protein
LKVFSGQSNISAKVRKAFFEWSTIVPSLTLLENVKQNEKNFVVTKTQAYFIAMSMDTTTALIMTLLMTALLILITLNMGEITLLMMLLLITDFIYKMTLPRKVIKKYPCNVSFINAIKKVFISIHVVFVSITDRPNKLEH